VGGGGGVRNGREIETHGATSSENRTILRTKSEEELLDGKILEMQEGGGTPLPIASKNTKSKNNHETKKKEFDDSQEKNETTVHP